LSNNSLGHSSYYQNGLALLHIACIDWVRDKKQKKIASIPIEEKSSPRVSVVEEKRTGGFLRGWILWLEKCNKKGWTRLSVGPSMPSRFATDPNEAVGVNVSATAGGRQGHDFSQRWLRLALPRIALHHSALAASKKNRIDKLINK
jgi:hypothetical protein